MIALAVTCPACGAALTLKAAPPPGVTRAKCPKCGGVVPLDSVDPAPPSGHETAGLNASANSTSDATCPGPGRPAPASDEFPFLAPPERPDEIGRLGPYRVLAAIGHGGMGAVFRAEDPALRRHVALKVMLPQFATNEVAKARFLREARAQAAVEHDHVAAIHQVGEDRGVPFIALPLLKGQSLSDALKANPVVPVAEAVRIAREIAAGLAAAHETGLVLRDVKPGNVWLEGKSRRVKLLDFGLARAAGGAGDDDPAEPVTQTGSVVGTPAYMSPEQARGEHVDARTDVFCLGVVLYQLLAGRVPFSAPSVTGVLIAVATETPPAPHDLNPNVAPALGDFVMRLLAKNPAARPPARRAPRPWSRSYSGRKRR